MKYFAVMVEDEDADNFFNDVDNNWPTAAIKQVVLDGSDFSEVEKVTV